MVKLQGNHVLDRSIVSSSGDKSAVAAAAAYEGGGDDDDNDPSASASDGTPYTQVPFLGLAAASSSYYVTC